MAPTVSQEKQKQRTSAQVMQNSIEINKTRSYHKATKFRDISIENAAFQRF